MKRNAIALLLHLFKNGLVSKKLLRESLDRFIETLSATLQSYPQLRINLIVPGYLLECADPLLLANLRDLCKKNFIEMICTGYTEPFLSLSPPALTIQNIKHGLSVIEDLTGQLPKGFIPPFSNWEPSFIAALRALGFRYTLLSNDLFSEEAKSACGYWVAEHTGSSIGLIGTNAVNFNRPVAEFADWIRSIFEANSASAPGSFCTLHYLLPLCSEKTGESFSYLNASIGEIDTHLLSYQPICIGEYLNTLSPIGLQYVPTSLQIGRGGAVNLHFLNHLFSFDQIGFMQRKLLDIYDRLDPSDNASPTGSALANLVSAQDINRFLPGADAGFELFTDRRTTYARLIATDRELHARKPNSGPRVRITDFLRNGEKTIILSNNSIKAFIDPHRGGQIIGFDLRSRNVNLCSTYHPGRRQIPDIIVSGSSQTWFLDRILPEGATDRECDDQLLADSADFQSADFDHRIHKTTSGLNVALVRAGSFIAVDKPSPLRMEKVFGIERDLAELLFVFQLANPSLLTYRCTFSTEINLALGGIGDGSTQILAAKNKYDNIGSRGPIRIPSLTHWSVTDRTSGVRLQIRTQKPVTLWCQPCVADAGYEPEGLRMTLLWPIVLEPSSQVNILGKISCKPIKFLAAPEATDAV